MMLILEFPLKLQSKQGDFTAAFLYADLGEDEEVYVEMSFGFRKKGTCLSLKTTLYGFCQSPRMILKYSTKAMNSVGMKTSAFDPCTFIWDRFIAVAFGNNILNFSTDEKYVNKLRMKPR